ncbi:hypothetical protein CF319_g6000 [Tilletia indica]|nr:hypothetical protein CF319_g6000 [Tilletia indica]
MEKEKLQTAEAAPSSRPSGMIGPRPPSTPRLSPGSPPARFTPAGSKRNAVDADRSASPIIRKVHLVGGLAKKLGVTSSADPDASTISEAQAEVDAVEGRSWSDIQDEIGTESAEARAAAIYSDSSDDSSMNGSNSSRVVDASMRTGNGSCRVSGTLDMELDQAEGPEWRQQQPRSQRRQSARVRAATAAAAVEATAAAEAAELAKEQAAAMAATARAVARSTAQATAPVESNQPAPILRARTTANAAIATAAQEMRDADNALQTRAQARTKAYAGLMTHMEKMCSEGNVSSTELDLLLAACKAAHRHAEAQGFAPAFAPELINALTEYDVRRPDQTARLLSPPVASVGRVAPTGGSYSAALGQPARPTSGPAGMQLPPPPRHPFAHLKDKHIVGQGRGSALKAAVQGGRHDDRLFARGAPKGDPFTLVNQVNTALAASGAPHSVRVDVITDCPTGLAISPKHGCSTHQLQMHSEVIAGTLGASSVDMDEQWERWVLHDVATHAGSGEIDNDFITAQLKEVFPGVIRGEAKRLCRQDEDWTAKVSTPVAFYTTTHANFRPGMEVRILGRKFNLRRHQLRPSTAMCGVCGSYRHKTASCESAARCLRCGKYGHSQEEHEAQCQPCLDGSPCIPQCMHCRGAHAAGDRACKNRPTWDRFARAYVLTRGQELSRINAVGDRSRNKLVQSIEGPARGSNALPLGARGAAASSQ